MRGKAIKYTSRKRSEYNTLQVNAYYVMLTDATYIDSMNFKETGITIGIKHKNIAMAFREMVFSDDEKT